MLINQDLKSLVALADVKEPSPIFEHFKTMYLQPTNTKTNLVTLLTLLLVMNIS